MRISITQKTIAAASVIALGAIAFSAPVLAKSKTETEHLRGTVTDVTSTGFTVKTDSGMQKVSLSSKTKFAAVTPGDLSNIKKGTFIGTANVDDGGKNKALEMVIFPASMKGTGLGDYSWDLSPSMVNKSATSSDDASTSGSATAGSSMTNGTVSAKTSGDSNGSMTAGSSMTNGTVDSKMSGSSMASGSSMTNGTVTSSASGDQSMTLKVNYGKGSKTIHVPADVPTVQVQKGSKSDIKSGAHVFVAGPKGSSPFKAAMVIVGLNGTVPPM